VEKILLLFVMTQILIRQYIGLAFRHLAMLDKGVQRAAE
jgi:hypothetical protein